ncbi:MAG: hypothetical protein ACC657_07815 [Thiohalomonadales bacterium]
MKKILILVISIMLLSCQSEDKTKTTTKVIPDPGTDTTTDPGTQLSQLNCIDNTSTGNSGDPNSIDLQILELIGGVSSVDTAMEGVVVQLDNDGVCIKSNAQGFITFGAVSNGEHDIHIFSPDGYGWVSIYNVAIGQFKTIDLMNVNTPAPAPKSYISLQGAVSNVIAGNNYSIYFITDTGEKYRGQKLDTTLNTITNYAVDFEFPLAEGSSVTGDIIALEYQNDSTTSESLLVDATTAILSSVALTTKAATGNYASNTANDISFRVNKHNNRSNLSIDNVIVPEQLKITNLAISGHNNSVQTLSKPNVDFFSFNDLTKVLAFPRIFTFINHFRFTDVHLSMRATLPNDDQNFWTYTNNYIKNAPAFTVTPQISRLPIIPDNQVGDLITWDAVNPNLTSLYLEIKYVENEIIKTPWYLSLDPKVTSITLPKIPNGITKVLSADINYEIRLNGTIGTDPSVSSEFFRVNSKTWKP